MAVTLLPSSSSSESVCMGKQPPPPALYCSLMAWGEEGGGREGGMWGECGGNVGGMWGGCGGDVGGMWGRRGRMGVGETGEGAKGCQRGERVRGKELGEADDHVKPRARLAG